MNIAMYSPYVPGHHGGGEKHFFDVASTLAEQHTVTISLPSSLMPQVPALRSEYEAFLGIDLGSLRWQASPLAEKSSIWQKMNWTAAFDYLYAVTDGSLFLSRAKKNNVHFQVPFTHPPSLAQRLKLRSWQLKNANSQFTRSVIERVWGVTVPYVHHPKVDVERLFALAQPKKKTIVSVGRFFRQLHSKRQDVLIDCFAQLRAAQPKLVADWSLELIGTVEDEAYVADLKKQAAGLPISFVLNCSRRELEHHYARASIFWHAAGFEIDETVEPERVEHFGIATVEAMAAGAVPLVMFKGGQKEILGSGLAELGWQTRDECVAKTIGLITDLQRRQNLALQCQQRAADFGSAVFKRTLYEMVEN